MTRIPILTPRSSSEMLQDIRRDLIEIQREVRWLMLEERLERFRQEFRSEVDRTLRVIDAKGRTNGAADDSSEDGAR